MNIFFKLILTLTFFASFFSCKKDDPVQVYSIPYAEQYPKDLTAIETFLKTHKINETVNPGHVDDRDVSFSVVPDGDSASIWGDNATTPKASLLNKIVNSNGVDYKVYYVSLSDGTQQKPYPTDSVCVAYKGRLLDDTTFDQAQNPNWFILGSVIQGWNEIIPLFKTGTSSSGTDGTTIYSDFGAGVMFLPSGLAYYSQGQGLIPPYSPLIFNFKLQNVEYVDNDNDGILSRDEDINLNGILTDDDTDGDGIPNYRDIDDDGDYYTTKSEIKIPGSDPATYYLYSQVPSCSADVSSPTRIRKYLDPSCH